MGWISLLFLTSLAFSAPLPVFMSKYSPDSIRYISMDGRYAYVQKKAGVMGLVTNYRSIDFISESGTTSFLMTGTAAKNRLAIEAIPNTHSEMSLLKNHLIRVVDYGNIKTRDIGQGRAPKLHLQDEWISYFDMVSKEIKIQNLLTTKSYTIKTIKKDNPFFIPEVEMVSSQYVVYTDVNTDGYSAIIQHDLISGKANVLQKSSQSGTRIELCSHSSYLAYGEFPYEGVQRASSIQQVKLTGGVNLASATTLYEASSQDIGNMVCLSDAIYFVKTLHSDNTINHKVTEAARLDLKSLAVQIKTELKNVSQIIEMDGRVMIPYRGDFLVLEGKNDLTTDVLNKKTNNEELQLDI